MTELVTVLVPLFDLSLSPLEKYALQGCQKHLGDFPITFLKSDQMPLPAEVRNICPNADSVSFDPRNFISRTNYTRFLLGGQLYEQFSWSRYLLILELNAAVTKNELAYWCRQGYDFIQPIPVQDKVSSPFVALKRRLDPTRSCPPGSELQREFEENSGLSLRRVKACQKIIKRRKRAINQFLADYPEPANDSLFWEYYVNRWRPELITPNALARHHFAQSQGQQAPTINPQSTPFGLTALKRIPALDYPTP